MSDDLVKIMFFYFVGVFAVLLIIVYIIRSIFNIPTIISMHKAQVRLLEQIAKAQGVEPGKVKTIITEVEQSGW